MTAESINLTPQQRAERFTRAVCIDCTRPVFEMGALRCMGCTFGACPICDETLTEHRRYCERCTPINHDAGKADEWDEGAL
jgi:hypothetical protein